jgi:methionyl-tRNA formyltransferase
MGKIEWSKKALDICNLIRGLTPFPKATCIFEDKALKITKALPIDSTSDKAPGQIISVNKDSFDVCCGESTVLRIFEIQPEAKKVMSVEDYLKGNKIEVNTVLS